MHVDFEVEHVGIERHCGVDVINDVANGHWHFRTSILGYFGADCSKDVAERHSHLPTSAQAGWNSSMRLPAGSLMRIWRPPGPATRSLRNDSPAPRSRAISASRSSTIT